jgi:hypothetical protein
MTEEQELEQLEAELAALEVEAKASTVVKDDEIAESPSIESTPVFVSKVSKPKAVKKKETEPVLQEKPTILEEKVEKAAPNLLFGAAKLKTKFLKR